MTGDAGGERERGATGAVDVLLGCAAFLLGLAVRSLGWPAVLTAEGVRLVGPDAHYHLRRIVFAVENFPGVLTRDPYVNFPRGGEPIWTPLFDQTIALAAWIAVGPGDPEGVERLAVWVPPLLGGATVAAAYFLGQRFFGRRVGVVAAAFACLLPSSVHYAQVGLVDHHVAVALLETGLFGALLAWLRPGQQGLRAAIVLGAALGAGLLLWPGMLLLVGVVQIVLALSVLSAAELREAQRRAADAAIAHGVAFLLVAPFSIGRTWAAWGSASPVVLSGFQPLWLGLPALGFALCFFAWRAGIGGAGRPQRAAQLALALAVPGVSALAVAPVREGVADAAAWFFRREPFQALVAESTPLFSDGRSFTLEAAHGLLSPLFYLLPAMLLALVATRRRTAQHRVVALWCAALFAATVAQQRFASSLGVPFALAIACSAELALCALPAGARAARAALWTAFGGLAVIVLPPLVVPHLVAFGTARRALEGERVHAPERVSHQDSLVSAALWLRDHSPATDGWLSEGARPEYGVLTAWGDGHVVRYVARRPVVQDNFGDDAGREGFDDAERYFAAPDEEAALAVAEGLRVRYVLVREAGSGHAPRPYPSRSMLVRLNRLRGSAGPLETGDHPGAPALAPALARHRLVYESPRVGQQDGRYKLYEIVEAARIDGDASPGALVEARLALEGPGGVRLAYRAHAVANHAGRYELRLPYPTEPFTGLLAPTSPYAIESGGESAVLRLREAAVRSGAVLEGPRLVR